MVRHPLSLLLMKIAESPRYEDVIELRRGLLARIEETCTQGPRPTLAIERSSLCRQAYEGARDAVDASLSLLDDRDGRSIAVGIGVPSWWETTGEEPLVAVRITRSFTLEDRDFHANTITVLKASFARLLVGLGLAHPLDSFKSRRSLWKRY